MRKRLAILFALLAVAGGAGWSFRAEAVKLWRWLAGSMPLPVAVAPRPDPESYARLAGDLGRWRGEFAARHRAAGDETGRSAVEHDARVLLETVLPEMMRCWLGTPWDFNGTAAKPGAGKIACGYFVATVLKDAGFVVDRYQLAQQPSANIMRSFLAKEACVLTVDEPYEAFVSTTAARAPGIYLVGLDTHVGFVVVDGRGSFRFIHSSGSRPWRVVDESPDQAEVLRRSSWRMLGNLTADGEVLRRWLAGGKIAVRGVD